MKHFQCVHTHTEFADMLVTLFACMLKYLMEILVIAAGAFAFYGAPTYTNSRWKKMDSLA